MSCLFYDKCNNQVSGSIPQHLNRMARPFRDLRSSLLVIYTLASFIYVEYQMSFFVFSLLLLFVVKTLKPLTGKP